MPDVFTTPTTPKVEEATALRHRNGGDGDAAELHFTQKLSACFAEARRVCDANGVITVMFAHQTTKAWSALISALFNAGFRTEIKLREAALTLSRERTLFDEKIGVGRAD